MSSICSNDQFIYQYTPIHIRYHFRGIINVNIVQNVTIFIYMTKPSEIKFYMNCFLLVTSHLKQNSKVVGANQIKEGGTLFFIHTKKNSSEVLQFFMVKECRNIYTVKNKNYIYF